MKIYISSDIEGTGGIAHWDETDKEARLVSEYTYFAARMSDEVAAVCRGINDFDGNSEILVKDAHGTGRNIDHSKLPENVCLNRGFSGHPQQMMNLLDSTYDGSMLTGYHSPSYCDGNPMAHTMTGAFSRVVINGKLASEFLINYYTSLYFGVPMIFAAGDGRLMEIVKETDPDIITVETMRGFGASVTSPHPKRVQERLQTGAREAVGNAARLKALAAGKLPKHFTIEQRFREHSRAGKAAYYPGAKRVNDHTVAFECDDYMDFLKFFMYV